MKAMIKAPSRQAWSALSLILIAALLLGACTPPAPTASHAAPQQKPTEIKIALIPIIDALPIFVATQKGYFTQNNLDVTIIPVASAAERDQLMAAGQAVGMINDLVSVTIYNKQATQIQAVRFARTARSDTPMYRILGSANSGIKTPAELAGVPIGISQGTVIEYITDRLLEKEGFTADQIQIMAVPKMPERMALLNSGELKAATMPEPFSTIAMNSGAVVILDDSKYPDLGTSLISFQKSFIDENPEAVRGFLAAIEQAVADINQDPNAWRSLLVEKKLVPEALKDTFPVPLFPTASIPNEAQFSDVVDWAKGHSLLERDLPYGESITSEYLPK